MASNFGFGGIFDKQGGVFRKPAVIGQAGILCTVFLAHLHPAT
jgi:hypothetical protein